jgi:GNAT superfamily N-acetyltransferase
MTEITLRPATQADTKAIAAILRELGWFEHINSEPPSTTAARVRANLELCQGDHSHTTLVAEDEQGLVVGYSSVHWQPYLVGGLEGYISELFVQAEKRGQGIGRQLLAAVKDEGRKRGAVRLTLFNRRIRESYEHKFYQQLGWEERNDMALFMLYLIEPKSGRLGG